MRWIAPQGIGGVAFKNLQEFSLLFRFEILTYLLLIMDLAIANSDLWVNNVCNFFGFCGGNNSRSCHVFFEIKVKNLHETDVVFYPIHFISNFTSRKQYKTHLFPRLKISRIYFLGYDKYFILSFGLPRFHFDRDPLL